MDKEILYDAAGIIIAVTDSPSAVYLCIDCSRQCFTCMYMIIL